VPTKRRRHAITETPPVEEALDELRKELGSDRVDLGELVILGARERLTRVRSERNRDAERLKDLAERVRNRQLTPLDLEAADAARRSWVRD
jgi:hypothetical protein